MALALRDALRSELPRQRIQAALTLARLEPPEPRSLPALVAALDAEDGDVRWSATRLLVEMGRGRGEVLPVLLGLAREGSPRARRMALAGLRELAPDEPEVARTLLAATRDPDAGVRRSAVRGPGRPARAAARSARSPDRAGGGGSGRGQPAAGRRRARPPRASGRAQPAANISWSSEKLPGPSSAKTRQIAARLMVYSAPGGSFVIR